LSNDKNPLVTIENKSTLKKKRSDQNKDISYDEKVKNMVLNTTKINSQLNKDNSNNHIPNKDMTTTAPIFPHKEPTLKGLKLINKVKPANMNPNSVSLNSDIEMAKELAPQ